MDQEKFDLILGSMLRDIGKILYRHYDGRQHGTSGRDFLQEEINISSPRVLDMVRYHHGEDLAKAGLESDHLAYISYIGDNIAAFSDRRSREQGYTFDTSVNLESVFNILNGNDQKASYEPRVLDSNEPIYPSETIKPLTEDFYGRVLEDIIGKLKNLERTKDFLQSHLELVEATLSYVPSSTNTKEYVDISLYDHLKLTTAYSAAIYDYLESKSIRDYKTELFDKTNDFYDVEAFVLVNLDISGIQNFIYQITKENALKSLRARSFYLELILEQIVDEILERLDLIRSNLLYIGGGGAYLILANTDRTKQVLEDIQKEVNNWFMDQFGIELYLTLGYKEATANNFRNMPEGSYSDLFKSVSQMTSDQKIKRYSYNDLARLNSKMTPDGDRECKNCNRTDSLTEDNLCTICDSLIQVSQGIFEEDYFALIGEEGDKSVPMPFGQWMYPMPKDKLKATMENNPAYVRAYSKNQFHTGYKLSTNLWVGDYSYDKMVSTLAEDRGIERIGVLRADVDNLGTAFMSGFERDGDSNLVTLSRTSTLSRLFSMFFKSNINYILENPSYHFIDYKDDQGQSRICNIIYSGGDDIFLIGHWAHVIEFAVDLHMAFEKFSLGAVTLSAGIGIYHSTYPISHMADETAKLEAAAKAYIGPDGKGKNALCLLEPRMVFSWSDFIDRVIGQKHKLLKDYFDIMYPKDDQSGHSSMYQLLYYLRNIEDKINFPRVLYLFSRKDPKTDQEKGIKSQLISKLYDWLKDDRDRKELEMAIILLVYENRGDQS